MIQTTNVLLPFHSDIIKCFAIQHKGKFFALSSETSLKFGILEGDSPESFNFIPLPAKEGTKRHVSLLLWSPSDEILAAISEVVTLWKFEKGAFKVISDFREQCTDITSASWSPNSDFLATGYINGTIIIRKIDNGEIRHKLTLDGKVLSIAWDPLDKYIVVLKNDNSLKFFKTLDFSLLSNKSLMISNNKANLVLKREDRKIAWSTDYKNILVPSLDDHILPFVTSTSRSDFHTKFNLLGPFSSINCVKFNPFFFKEKKDSENHKGIQQEENVFQIMAMGDNDGNISIWKLPVFNQKFEEKPLWIFKTHADSNQLIEDISWAENGSLIIATTLRKYLFLIYFQEECIGIRLSEDECNKIVESIYGIRAGEKRRVRVFKGTQSLEKKSDIAKDLVAQVSLTQPVKVVFTEQTVSFAGGKKRIMPQIQKVIIEPSPEEQAIAPSSLSQTQIQTQKLSQNQNIHEGNGITSTGSNINPTTSSLETQLDENKNQSTAQMPVKETIELMDSSNVKEDELKAQKTQKECKSGMEIQEEIPKKILKQTSKEDSEIFKKGATKQIAHKKKSKTKTSNSETHSLSEEPERPIRKSFFLQTCKGTIEIENKSKGVSDSFAIIRKAVYLGEDKKYLWSDCLQGNILFADANDEMILYYSDLKVLHVVNHDRKILCLPIFVKDVSLVVAGSNFKLAFCTKNLDLKLIDVAHEEVLVNENLKDLCCRSTIPNSISKLIIGKEGGFSVVLSDFSIFCYNFGMKVWQKLSCTFDFQSGISKEKAKMLEDDFFKYEIPSTQKLFGYFDRLFSNEKEFHGELWMKRLLEASQTEEKMRFFLQKNDISNFMIESKRFVSALVSANESTRLMKFLEEVMSNEFSLEALFLLKNGISKQTFFEGVKEVLRSQRATDFLEEIELFCAI